MPPKGKSHHRWPGEDDRTVVEEMLRDRESEHWFECREFVKKRVSQATNIPGDRREDIAQDAMIKIDRSLHTFQYQCAFSTWLFEIVRNCIIDVHRKLSRGPTFIPLLEDPHDDSDHEGDAIVGKAAASAEDEFFVREELDKAFLALQEYLRKHGKKRRNARILQMVLFENRSLEEAAREVGCSAPVAGYVVRAAQIYVRRKLGM